MFLNEFDYEKWCKKLSFQEATINLISGIRTSNPFRSVRNGISNVIAKYPSMKMEVSIQAESQIELAGIWEMEDDNEVIEFYDQPGQIKLKYQAKNEKVVGLRHTPDFFVIRKGSAGWEEWKTEEQLLELAIKFPTRYQKREDGSWYSPPGQEYADEYGLYYRLRSSAEINWIYMANLNFLEDYFRLENPIVQDRDAVLKVVKEKPGMTLEELLVEFNFSPDDIYTLIVTKEIHVDLINIKISDRRKMLVFSDKETALGYQRISSDSLEGSMFSHSLKIEIGTKIMWESRPFTIVNFAEEKISLAPDEGELITLQRGIFFGLVDGGAIKGIEIMPAENELSKEILMKASKEDFEVANQRYEIIAPTLNGIKELLSTVPERTIRYWLRKYKLAKEALGNGYLGLLPDTKSKGNRSRKLPEETISLMEEYVLEVFETPNQKTKMQVYGSLVNACEKKGIIAPNYQTFVKRTNNRPIHEQTEKRKGRKAAYLFEEFYWRLGPKIPKHGERPFDIAHVDHTELDMELIDPDTSENLGRVWLSILIDSFTRRLLAVYLTFDPPSYRSCMMLFDECVRRYNRLPQTIVVDGGKEFKSTYFESFLAIHEITKKTRPASKARFGSVCERIFGTTNTRFVHNLTGNTQITKNVRQITKQVNPKNLAVWTLEAFNKKVHKTFNISLYS